MTDELLSIGEALEDADGALLGGNRAAPAVMPTGFGLLDTYLGGGLRGGELTLVGGPHGLGKTAFILQLARHAASLDQAAVVFSYEHDADDAPRAAHHGRGRARCSGSRACRCGGSARPWRAGAGKNARLEERLASTPGGVQAVTELRRYGDRLLLHRSSGSTTGLHEIREVIAHGDRSARACGRSSSSTTCRRS